MAVNPMNHEVEGRHPIHCIGANVIAAFFLRSTEALTPGARRIASMQLGESVTLHCPLITAPACFRTLILSKIKKDDERQFWNVGLRVKT